VTLISSDLVVDGLNDLVNRSSVGRDTKRKSVEAVFW
jgi:hypothetical protein